MTGAQVRMLLLCYMHCMTLALLPPPHTHTNDVNIRTSGMYMEPEMHLINSKCAELI